ncbi:TSC complex subunit 1a isoform X2 [Girardinichthys multiradiatus]|uniref:TSC complex subunit 1a isoform X2 n=1 Tax=Girardinichthys multiradiatus TaxID=208333 RepID=UPI001FAB6F37|nr:TSC complex subunit 1a isoform X2 [Girardinichthys multiradiatus]
MSREQVSITDLLLSLESSELQEVERVKTAVNQQLSTDRGGAVLSSLVEHYLDSSSSQVVLLLSSIREPHHKVLLEKLNEALNRPGNRLAGVTLLGHLIRKQPPWVHHISQSPILLSLLRCLKTDGDVVVLITGVLVLITLLPMIPQAGKQHIYDFFDVFGRLVSWSYKNPGHVAPVYLVHLHAGVYSLFHRLYGMFPCNFISYLRLHYSMEENLDTFQEVVKPMLEHVRIHPELVTGTQDYELDPSRWRCYEVHDIIIECARLSLDPLESSCEEEVYYSPPASPKLPPQSFPHLHLDLSSNPHDLEPISSSGISVSCPPQLTLNTSYMQADDLTWSPSSQCGLSTPPPEAATSPAPSLSRSTSISGVKCPSPASVPVTMPSGDSYQPVSVLQVTSGFIPKEQHEDSLCLSSQVMQQPIRAKEEMGLRDMIGENLNSADVRPRPASSQLLLLTSTPASSLPSPSCSRSLCLTPPHSSSHVSEQQGPAPPYESLFELALPRAATLFIGKKMQEALERAVGEQREEEQTSVSPLKVLDRMIVHGNDAHERLSRRFSAGTKSMDRSHLGGPAPGEEPQTLKSQLLLVHSQLQYERFKRQQHAIRNRRLLRRVINVTALEEQTVAMKGQLSVQDEEIRCLKSSLDEEQRRFTKLKQDAKTQSKHLHDQIQQLLQQQQDKQQENQLLQSELVENRGRLKDLEAELQRANNKANHAEHLLTQLSLKLCSSEQLQQQIFLLNQQLILLRETNRALSEQLEEGDPYRWTEEAMLQRSVGKEFQRLKDCNVQQKQKLEAANHRIAELENQLAKKEKLILDQKKLLEDTKNQNRAELSASESRCVALRRLTQTLQTEMLHLYSQIHLDTQPGSDTWTHSSALDVSSRPIRDSTSSPITQDSNKSRPSSSSAVGIINGAVEVLSSSSPLPVSPFDSPLAVGSFLEQQARRMFGPSSQSLEGEEEKQEEKEEEDAHPESPPLGQEVEEATFLTGSPHIESPSPAAAAADLALTVRQRRDELSIMDYNESLPEF